MRLWRRTSTVSMAQALVRIALVGRLTEHPRGSIRLGVHWFSWLVSVSVNIFLLLKWLLPWFAIWVISLWKLKKAEIFPGMEVKEKLEYFLTYYLFIFLFKNIYIIYTH